LHFVFPTIFGSILYWAVGLNPNVGNFFIFLALLILLNLVGQGFGLLVGTIVPTQQIGMAIFPVITTLLLLFSGFYVNASTIPNWLIWLYYLSLFKYGFEVLVINEFSNAVLTCLPSELVGPTLICPVTSGIQVLQTLSLQKTVLYLDVLVLVGLVFSYRILGYVTIRWLNKPKVA